MIQIELDKVLELHKKWLEDKADGIMADLRGANLSGADLEGANLKRANLRGANLAFAKSLINLTKLEYYGKMHSAVYFNGNILIGCENYSVDFWLENYEQIGIKNKYTKEQINDYGVWIKFVASFIANKESK